MIILLLVLLLLWNAGEEASTCETADEFPDHVTITERVGGKILDTNSKLYDLCRDKNATHAYKILHLN